jgi:hypothetical protein
MADQQPADVADLEARRSQHQADAEALYETALAALSVAGAQAYTDVFESTLRLRQLPDARVLVAVMVGNPLLEYTGSYVGSFSPDPTVKIEPEHLTAMALAAVKAVNPGFWKQFSFGLRVAELWDSLNARADAGDAGAAQALAELQKGADPSDTNPGPPETSTTPN